jgi:hypothetical protein
MRRAFALVTGLAVVVIFTATSGCTKKEEAPAEPAKQAAPAAAAKPPAEPAPTPDQPET